MVVSGSVFGGEYHLLHSFTCLVLKTFDCPLLIMID